MTILSLSQCSVPIKTDIEQSTNSILEKKVSSYKDNALYREKYTVNRNRAKENALSSNKSWMQRQVTDNVNKSAKGPVKAGSVMADSVDDHRRSSGESTATFPHRWPVGDSGPTEGRP